MHPGFAALRQIARGGRSSHAPVFTLPAWTHTMVGDSCRHRGPAERLGIDRAVVVGRDRLHGVGADAEQPERTVDRRVTLLAGHDSDPGSAGEATRLHIPAGPLEHAMACRGEPNVVRALCRP